MKRPTVEVADILRIQGQRFRGRYRSSFDFQQRKAFRALQNCRTAALGGHLDACPQCGYQAISYNSCRNRHCPKCQAQARERWLAAREQELLATHYFHAVFTVPHELNLMAQDNARLFYHLLFTASAATLLEVAAHPKHLGAQIGILSILHTWGQNLLAHPHIHCVIPAGGISPDHTRWVRPRYRFFVAVKILSRVFRGKFIAGLKRLYRRKQLRCTGPCAALKQFRQLLRRLHYQDWVVYAKPAFGGARQGLRYLGRYTHRVAISNHRLMSFDGERVTFRWKDYAHGSQQREMTLQATEFLRRFFLHVLPKGFVRIRHFGFLANRFRLSRLTLCRQLLASECLRTQPAPVPNGDNPIWHCPHCGSVSRPSPPSSCPHGAVTLTLHRAVRQTGPQTCAPHAGDVVCPRLRPYPSNLLKPAFTRPFSDLSAARQACSRSFRAHSADRRHRSRAARTPFNLHTHWPRPPRTPAASF